MICEIGLCHLNLDTGNVEPIFNIICKEKNKEFNEKAWIFQNSDLSIEALRKAPFLEDCRKTLQEFLDEYPCTAFNCSFDFGFLESRDFRIHKKFWDPMHKLTSIIKIRRYDGSYKWPSVQEAYDFFYPKERYIEKHRALDDAKHEAKIIYATFKLLKSERIKAIKDYQAGKYHGCVQERFQENCGLCLYRFSCKYIRVKEDKL